MIIDWWKKTKDTASSCKKIPLLITKENNKPILLFVSGEGSNIITEQMRLIPICSFKIDNCIMYVYLFEDFIKLDPVKFKLVCNQYFEDISSK